MPVSIKGTGGGSVTLTAGAAATDTTLTIPNVTGTVLQSGTAVTAAQGGTGLTSPGTVGNVLTSTGSAWASSAPASSVPSPSAIGQVPFSTDGSTWTATQKITQGTSVSPTTSTSIDFTSIPSWVKKITVTFAALKSSGGSAPTVRLGTSGGIVSSGYVGTIEGAAATGPAFATISLGFDLLDVGSAAVANLSWSGLLNLAKVDTGNTWVANYVAGNTGAVGSSAMFWMGGSVNLGATLTTLRITSANGTVQFTGGTVNILYE